MSGGDIPQPHGGTGDPDGSDENNQPLIPATLPQSPPRSTQEPPTTALSLGGAARISSPPARPTPPRQPPLTTPPRRPKKAAVAVKGDSPRLSGSKSPASTSSWTPSKKKKMSVICPICKRDLFHDRALCGHIRWHSQEEREAASVEIASALSSALAVAMENEEAERAEKAASEEGTSSSKKFKVPDLNKSPPPEEEEDGGGEA